MGRPLETSPYRLLVEGTDDANVILHLLKRHGYNWDDGSQKRPYVLPVGGVANLARALAAAGQGFQRLGIVVDADTDIAVRCKSVQQPTLQGTALFFAQRKAIPSLGSPSA